MRAVRLSIEAVDQGLEAAARTLRWSSAGFFYRDAALDPAWRLGRRDFVLRPQPWRIRGYHHVCSNIPGQTRTLPLALYTLTQVPGGEAAALRLCIISVLLSLLALVGSEIMARRLNQRLKG